MNQTRAVMTLDEVAAYLKVHSLTIYRLVNRKQQPAIRIGSKFRFRKADIDEWITAKEEAFVEKL
jgi:excisionase family DNA binding protein